MESLRKWCQRLHAFFAKHYGIIAFQTAFFAIIYLAGKYYEQFELKFLLPLLRWLLSFENMPLLLIVLIALLKSFVVLALWTLSYLQVKQPEHASSARIKRRYRRHIVMRLIADLDRCECFRATLESGGDGLDCQLLLDRNKCTVLHDRIQEAIDRFRRDVRKVYEVNDVELTLPVEELFYVNPASDRELKRHGYGKMSMRTTDSLIATLLRY